ncbi:MAG TPA: hypothetical protein ENJ56_06815 [Anaerolineae bacterium]|nr:hypothetical protein [Anaerolineae bacterium]
MGIQSIPHVKMFWNGKMVGEFRGLQFESNIRKWIDEKTAQGAPRGKVRIPRMPADRIAKGKQLLKKGKGFEATLNLRDLEEAEAQTLLPLAQWLWDVNDGDALVGDQSADSLALDILTHIEDGDLTTAQTKLATLSESQNDSLSDVQNALAQLIA